MRRKEVTFMRLGKIFLWTLFAIMALAVFQGNEAWAASEYKYTALETLPGAACDGSQNATTCFTNYLSGIYGFFIGTAGIAAMGLIIWGGIQYFFSAGNVAKAGDGKEMITNALFGLFIVMVSYLILYVINPDLVTLNMDAFPTVEITSKNPS